MPRFLKTYSKQCPRCKAYFPGVWKECGQCKIPLVSARGAYYMKWFRMLCFLLAAAAFVAASSYYLQPAQRKQYEKGYAHLRAGNYADAGTTWWDAFTHGPYYAGGRSLALKIKERLPKSD